MLQDNSNSNIPNGDGDNVTPQFQGEVARARQLYIAAYIQSLPLPLRHDVIHAFDVVTLSGQDNPPTSHEIELVKGEAGRVLRYLGDISAGVYDITPDGFLPELGHNDPCYFTGPTDNQACN